MPRWTGNGAGTDDTAAEAITEGRDAVQRLRTSATETNDVADSLQAFAEDLANENGYDAGELRVRVRDDRLRMPPVDFDFLFGEAHG